MRKLIIRQGQSSELVIPARNTPSLWLTERGTNSILTLRQQLLARGVDTKHAAIAGDNQSAQADIAAGKIKPIHASIQTATLLAKGEEATEKATVTPAAALKLAEFRIYESLQEPEIDTTHKKVIGMLKRNEVPEELVAAGESLLAHPPEEDIWIAGPMVIAGLCKVLRIERYQPLPPVFGELRVIDVPLPPAYR